MAGPLTVLIVDCNPIWRGGLRAVLDTFAEIGTVIETPGGHAAVALARETCPDVMVLGMGVPDIDAKEIACAHRETCGNARIVLVTTQDQRSDATTADAILLKGYRTEELVRTILG